MTWLRRDEGLVGWGVAAEIRPRGITRFSDADKWWTETIARADIRDDVNEPGSGLVCFGSFAFADDPGDSVLTVPQVVVGRRAGRTWLTLVGNASYAGPAAAPPRRRRTWSSATAPWTASTGWPSLPRPSAGSPAARSARWCSRAT